MPEDVPPLLPVPQTVPMTVRPIWRDPLFLLGLGFFVYSVAEELVGKPLTREAVAHAALGAIVALGRAAAPYVRSFLPFLDRLTPQKGE